MTIKIDSLGKNLVKQGDPLKNRIKANWKNRDNAGFYDTISLEANVMNSILGGLEAGEELVFIQSYIEQAKSILEVGAGYGRALNYLINHTNHAKIYAVERSPKLCTILQEKFADKVQIYPCDLLEFHPTDSYDLILWLFCGISDFTVAEQLSVLRKLSSRLMESGVLILETLSHTHKPENACSYEGQTYVIEVEDQTLQGLIPSPEMIKEYATQLKFKKVEYLPYETSSGSKRAFHVLSK